jgi:mRNA interferase MazF
MALKFHPEPGTILMCDFDKLGLKEPEMVKFRPALVISPRLKRRDDLLAVAPLSTTEPEHAMPYHYALTLDPPLPEPWDSPTMWVKADMLYTVRFDRLELVRTGRDHTGKRKYLTRLISAEQLKEIRKCVLNGLGMPSLTNHL